MSTHGQLPTSAASQAPVVEGPGLVLTALATARTTAETQNGSFEITLSLPRADAPRLVLQVSPTDTIEYLHKTIFAHTGVLPKDQHILADGKALDPSKTLAECGALASTQFTLDFASPTAEAAFAPPSHTIRSQVPSTLSVPPPLAPLPISAQSSFSPSVTSDAVVSPMSQSAPVLPVPSLPAWINDEADAPKTGGLTFKRRGSTKRPTKQVSEPTSPGGSTDQLKRSDSKRSSFSGLGWIFRRGSQRKGPVLQKESEAEKHGLFPRARAKVLHEWDGLIPIQPGQKGPTPKGLKLHLERPVLIGRVVNADWYQGYDPHDHYGCIPRNYVQVIEVMDPAMLPELGSDAPLSQPTVPSPRPEAPRTPSPFPQRPDSRAAYDETFSQTRVSVLFTSKSVLASPFPLSVTLTLLAAPTTRISSVTVNLSFPDGSILSLSPVSITSDKTSVHHTDAKGHEIDIGLNAGQAVSPATGSATWKNTGNKSQDYQRATWGRIEGAGIGTPTGAWVFEEDPGKAGRHGVPIVKTTQELDLSLDVRPVMCEYTVDVTVVEGDGAKPGFFNSKTYKSGKQTIFLP